MLEDFDHKTGRNVVGALRWQMLYLRLATQSRSKTIRKYRPEVKKFLLNQNERIVERFNSMFGIKSGDDSFPIQDIDHIVRLMMPDSEDLLIKDAVRPMHTSGIQKAVEDINTAAGGTVVASIANPKIVERLMMLGNRITKVNPSTRGLLKDIILRSVRDGENVSTIRDRIREAGLNEYYQGRAMTIARTETRMAYDAGGKVAYSEMGANATFDVVGCVGTLAGTNELGLSASYGDFTETIGSCGVLGVPMDLWDDVSNIHHINHAGCMVTSERL